MANKSLYKRKIFSFGIWFLEPNGFSVLESLERSCFVCVTTLLGKILTFGTRQKKMVERKLDRITKLFPEETNAIITLSLEKLVSTVEVTIPLNKRIIRAEVQDPDTDSGNG